MLCALRGRGSIGRGSVGSKDAVTHTQRRVTPPPQAGTAGIVAHNERFSAPISTGSAWERRPLVSTQVRCISLALRLCRPMCGKAVPQVSAYEASPYRPTLSIDWRLCLRAAPAQGVAFRRNLGCALPEGHSPSAHRAADPQEKPLVSSCVDTNGLRSQVCPARFD
jgi:hypothetical protein